MRDIKALAFVCALIAACATSGEDGGGDDGTNDPPSSDTPTCGDAVCAASEIGVCSTDCGSGNPSMEVCGNGACEGNEPTTCVSDCSTAAVCGNGQCESTETNATCPGDCTTGGGGGTLNCSDQNTQFACFACLLDPSFCTAPYDMNSCTACFGGGGGSVMCEGGQPDGTCNANAGENSSTCPFDCM
jgi:hypothetical protein